MRLWHYKLLPYLPDMQLKGQWRECCLIADTLAKKGTPNHLLVNRLLNYTPDHFEHYIGLAAKEMKNRGFTISNKSIEKISICFTEWVLRPSTRNFIYGIVKAQGLFDGWHNKEYLRMNMSNLAEKHIYGIGKSRITDEEWQRLLDGYKNITGEEYKI